MISWLFFRHLQLLFIRDHFENHFKMKIGKNNLFIMHVTISEKLLKFRQKQICYIITVSYELDRKIVELILLKLLIHQKFSIKLHYILFTFIYLI